MYNMQHAFVRSTSRGSRFFLVLASAALLVVSGSIWSAEEPHAGVNHSVEADPIGELEAEHKVIQAVVEATAQEAASIRKTGAVNVQRVGVMVAFFRNFADGCHHLKEERYLFPVLREHQVDQQPINLLLGQHQHGRYLLQKVSELLVQPGDVSAENAEKIARKLSAYAELMREHISAENNRVWSAARQQLSPDEKRKLMTAFTILEEVELGKDFHNKYHALSEQLSKTGASPSVSHEH